MTYGIKMPGTDKLIDDTAEGREKQLDEIRRQLTEQHGVLAGVRRRVDALWARIPVEGHGAEITKLNERVTALEELTIRVKEIENVVNATLRPPRL